MVSLVETRFVSRPATVCNRKRETVRSPNEPSLKFVYDACVLGAYDSTLLALPHGRGNVPVTIGWVIYFQRIFLPIPFPKIE